MYGLIGFPLGHSFSKEYFNNKFLQLGIRDEYDLFPISNIGMIEDIINNHSEKIKGLNVTIPYKESVIDYLNEIDSDSKAIGAVNVIKFKLSGGIPFLIGYNTDWKGFLLSLSPLIKDRTDIHSALILGTGGASKAIAYALKKLGIKYNFVSRDENKGDITYSKLTSEIISQNSLIVNCTPLGTYPNISLCPDIPYKALTPNHICYDLVYNPAETEFMKRSAKFGAVVKNGLEMLHNQADIAWKIWND